jgi:hypothetical protein
MLKYSLLLISIITILLGCEGKSTTKTKDFKPEIINGYTLPPKPDPKINNSTLLGIDANKNGIRDDIERWIVKKYKNKHISIS